MLDSIIDGLYITLSTLGLTLLLELLSLTYVYRFVKRNGGKNIYFKSIGYSVFNNLILGTSSYVIFTYLFLNDNEKSYIFGKQIYLFFETLLLLFIQSIGYYFAHKLMHTKRFYFMHKFHHEYGQIVIPMAANAVTIYEYVFAYLMPFIIGIILVRPDKYSLRFAIYCVSYTNLLIHTPFLLEEPIIGYLKAIPSFFVKPQDHFEHHSKLNKNFSAPIFNIDYINKNL